MTRWPKEAELQRPLRRQGIHYIYIYFFPLENFLVCRRCNVQIMNDSVGKKRAAEIAEFGREMFNRSLEGAANDDRAGEDRATTAGSGGKNRSDMARTTGSRTSTVNGDTSHPTTAEASARPNRITAVSPKPRSLTLTLTLTYPHYPQHHRTTKHIAFCPDIRRTY